VASRGPGANRGRGRRGTERSGRYARPWAKSRRGFRWALPEDEASVLRPKIATWSAVRRPPVAREVGVAPRKRDGNASDPPRRSAAPHSGAAKQRTAARDANAARETTGEDETKVKMKRNAKMRRRVEMERRDEGASGESG
jgi:hypothetical protein